VRTDSGILVVDAGLKRRHRLVHPPRRAQEHTANEQQAGVRRRFGQEPISGDERFGPASLDERVPELRWQSLELRGFDRGGEAHRHYLAPTVASESSAKNIFQEITGANGPSCAWSSGSTFLSWSPCRLASTASALGPRATYSICDIYGAGIGAALRVLALLS